MPEETSFQGDQHNLSGDFRGATINIKSTIRERRAPLSPPFMADPPPTDFVQRSYEFELLIHALLSQNESPVAITTALRGAGGYGKTTLAKSVCADKRVKDAFQDGILWVTLGERPGELSGKLIDWIEALTGERPGFTGIDAAKAAVAEALGGRKCLLVIDDAWNEAHLQPFLYGGKNCSRLITTRDSGTLPRSANKINVDAMRSNEAVTLLSTGLEVQDDLLLYDLARRLGDWPLLLKLANGVLHERVKERGQSLREALTFVNASLDEGGMTIFDTENSQERSQAVAITLEVSIGLLNPSERKHYYELAVFPEDTDIPLTTLAKYWNLTPIAVERLCDRLERLSLLYKFDLIKRVIRLHDVIRGYLISLQRDEVKRIHEQLLVSLSPHVDNAPKENIDSHSWLELDLPPNSHWNRRWANLSTDEPYLWDWLAYHLIEAGLGEELVETVKDLRYLAVKTQARSAYVVETDITYAVNLAPNDTLLRLLKRNFDNMSHLLHRCNTFNEIAGVMHSRLQHLSELVSACQVFENELSGLHITARYALPDLPRDSLLHTLIGHTGIVKNCVIDPYNKLIASASSDSTIKLWNVQTGEELSTLKGHKSWVNHCAISPDGMWIVSASRDMTIKVWDIRTGKERLTLKGHKSWVNHCAISPDGIWIVSASSDGKLKIWDSLKGEERLTLSGHMGEVMSCNISPDGTWIVSASGDGLLKVWDAKTGAERLTLRGHTASVNQCAISPDGTWIVSASSDGLLKVWDAKTGAERLTLRGHTASVNQCAISPDGIWIVSASSDKTVKVWDRQTGQERLALYGHMTAVYSCAISSDGKLILSGSGDKTVKVWDFKFDVAYSILDEQISLLNYCAVSPDGTWIVTVSRDGTIRIWDAKTGAERLTLRGHAASVNQCAISPDGTWIVTASSENNLKVWDARTGRERLTLHGHFGMVACCAVSSDGKLIISGSGDRTVKIWDAKTGVVHHTIVGHGVAGLVSGGTINDCAIDPAGKKIVSASGDITLGIWDVEMKTQPVILGGHIDSVLGCAFSPDGKWVVSTSADKTLKVWDPEQGSEQLTLRGHTSSVNCCAIGPDGTWMISVSDDKTLKVWDTQTGVCLLTYPVDAVLRACALFPDGQHIVAVGEAGVYWLRLVR